MAEVIRLFIQSPKWNVSHERHLVPLKCMVWGSGRRVKTLKRREEGRERGRGNDEWMNGGA